LYWFLGSPIKSSKLHVADTAAIEEEANISIFSCGEKDTST